MLTLGQSPGGERERVRDERRERERFSIAVDGSPVWYI